MKNFFLESLDEIYLYLEEELNKKQIAKIEVLNPDLALHAYAGESLNINDKIFIYRSYKNYNDLASLLFSKLLTPQISSESTVILSFYKLNTNDSFHKDKNLEDKYGQDSSFFRINKNEEASFYYYYKQALKNAKVEDKKEILNLGINKADEFDLIVKHLGDENIKDKNFYGIDYSKSAIEFAKKRFEKKNFNFYEHDINKLQELNLPKADLLISVGTLQSSSLNFKELFMNLVQNSLEKDGAIILAFPNCRWIDGEMIYGAKAPNYSFSEQSILYKDVYFCKKYLQGKKYRVTLTGKEYLFLTATSIRK